MSERDQIHVQTYKDADAGMSIAKSLWPGKTANDETIRATFADVMVHIRELRRNAPPQAGRAAPAPAGRPASSPAPAAGVGGLPECEKCGSALKDVRASKKSPKGPDYICSNRNCKSGEYRTGYWERDIEKLQKAKAYVAAKGIRDGLDSYTEKPEALEGDDDGLPF